MCPFKGSEEDLFYDAPSSPIDDKQFFPDNPMPLRSINKGGLVKDDAKKNMTDFILTFEISEVLRHLLLHSVGSLPEQCIYVLLLCFVQFSVELCRLTEDKEITVLHLDIEGLGTELKLRTFDMTSNTYLREICLKCPEYMGLY